MDQKPMSPATASVLQIFPLLLRIQFSLLGRVSLFGYAIGYLTPGNLVQFVLETVGGNSVWMELSFGPG